MNFAIFYFKPPLFLVADLLFREGVLDDLELVLLRLLRPEDEAVFTPLFRLLVLLELSAADGPD
jgi:hypothetical protein